MERLQKKGSFHVCRKFVDSNSILSCLVQKVCIGIRIKLVLDSTINCPTCASQHTDIVEKSPGKELNGQYLEL